ncbi:MAG: NUDIX hydrolase [Acidobacteria bacterium]|nr:NUDIX hydrolase [Acidobacteriota bacterium]
MRQLSATRRIRPIPAVNAVIVNGESKVLLTRRSSRVREPGKWCLPGGHLDGGEDWIAALRREVREETGLSVLREELIGIYSDPELTVSTEPSADGWHGQYVVACFLVRSYEGEVAPNAEVCEWGWFSADDLPSPMLVSHPIRIRDAFRFDGTAFVR